MRTSEALFSRPLSIKSSSEILILLNWTRGEVVEIWTGWSRQMLSMIRRSWQKFGHDSSFCYCCDLMRDISKDRVHFSTRPDQAKFGHHDSVERLFEILRLSSDKNLSKKIPSYEWIQILQESCKIIQNLQGFCKNFKRYPSRQKNKSGYKCLRKHLLLISLF